MKKIIPCKYFLLITFLISIVSINMYAWESYSSTLSIQTQEKSNEDIPQDSFYFSSIEAAPVSTGISRIQTRVTNNIIKIATDSYFSRISCTSQLNLQQFFTTKSSYNSFCSRKDSQGYYIYALRKLLI